MDLPSLLPPYPVAHNEASHILSLSGTPEPPSRPLDAQSCVSTGGRIWGPQDAVFLAQRALAGYWDVACHPVCFPLLWLCPCLSIKYFLASWNLSSVARCDWNENGPMLTSYIRQKGKEGLVLLEGLSDSGKAYSQCCAGQPALTSSWEPLIATLPISMLSDWKLANTTN
jgi:hypothetical protein